MLILLEVIRSYPVIVTAMLSPSDTVPRIHTCITKKVSSIFGEDGYVKNEDSEDYEGDTSDDDDIPDEIHRRSPTPMPTSTSAPPTGPRPPTPGLRRSSRLQLDPAALQTRTSTFPESSSSLQRYPSMSTLPPCPSSIWSSRWTPGRGRYEGLFSPELLAEIVYDAAAENTSASALERDGLEVRGRDITDLAVSFSNILGDAAKAGDFTNVLAAERSFLM